ncbi:FUSC family protein [Longirhabdus pacifica]|uniref:FUSC family protein n=1 Tax=Longirhabdus pacifica TaxID=2305227 RepID=UPI0013E8CB2A|nr:aromatic acid exporter family protein [Longirhabdus pacifica]
MKLGARMVKTGLAVMLSLYICQWFELGSPLVMVIAAVLTTQPSIYRSFKYFIEQVQANLIGALIGIFSYWLLGNEPVVIGTAVILVIIINLLLKFNSNISLSILTVVAVMEQPDGAALNRFLMIMVGIFISLLINALIFPPDHRKNLFSKMKKLNEDIFILLRNMVEGYLSEKSFRQEREKLHQDFNNLKQVYELFNEETVLRKTSRRKKCRQSVIFKQFLSILELELKTLDTFRHKEGDAFESDINENISDLIQYHERLFLKFEGKLELKYPSLKNEKLEVGYTKMLQDFMADGKMDSSCLHYLSIVAYLSQWKKELEHTDHLISSYTKFHHKK